MQYLPKWLVQLVAGLVAVLLIILAIGQIMSIADRSKSVDTMHTIKISADGKVTVTPDLATSNLAVVTDAPTADQAQSDNAKKMNKVIDFIKSQGVADADIQTSGFYLNQKFDYSNGKQTPQGYTASENVTVKMRDISKAGTIIAGAVSAGANQVSGINYDFADPDQYKEQAREDALKNAKDKAQKLADAAGLHLGKLVTFEENSATIPPIPYMLDKGAVGMGAPASTAPNVQPGSEDVTANITVVYEVY